jgi:serine/threonine-protein kinase RsbW
MSPTLTLTLPAVPEQVPVARRAIGRLCDRLGIAGERADDIRLAVSEASSNCVLHSAADGAADSLFTIEASVQGESLLVSVRDFRGGLVRGPIRGGGLGLGTQIIKHLSQHTDIASRPGGGMRVAMRFAVS